MSSNVERRCFRFGVFEADEAAAELRKHGVRIKLHSQPLQILLMLLERPAELVTREEMRQRIWGTDVFVDFDHGLNSAVNKIRTALDDSSAQPRYVETVAGKGYRFIAPVSRTPPSATASSPPPAPAQSEQPSAIETVADSGISVLSTAEELPAASRRKVATLFVLVQFVYAAIYLTALVHLREASEVMSEITLLPVSVAMNVLIVTAVTLIPVRLYLITAACLGLPALPAKFARMFPLLLPLDLLWALSPFLLVHRVTVGLALGMSAALVCLPFGQRSLVLMYRR